MSEGGGVEKAVLNTAVSTLFETISPMGRTSDGVITPLKGGRFRA
jgi:hypothetical protein